MPSRSRRLVEHQRPPFTVGSLTNLISIPIVTGLLVVGGFYYLTKDTLARHDTEITSDRMAREKLRDQFVANTAKTAEGIATLDKRAAIQEVQTQAVVQTLSKISDQLGSLSLSAGKPAR